MCSGKITGERKAEGKIGLQKKETGLQDYSPEKF
jgi:hypothetical protein